MIILMYENILFDLDGTIVDSKKGIELSFRFALDKYGIFYDGDIIKFIGPPFIESIPAYLGVDSPTTEKMIAAYREKYSEKGVFCTTLYRGIKDLLITLHDSGKKIALATTKPRVYAEIILKNKRIHKFFDFVGGSELDGSVTTKDDVLKLIFDKTKIRRDKTVLIGDTKFDCIGAKNAGIDFIGVTYGFGKKEELNAKYVVSSVSELKKLLTHLN